METRQLPSCFTFCKKWSCHSLCCSQIHSLTLEKTCIANYLEKIYPSSHRLLVVILICHALLNSTKIFIFDSLKDSRTIIHLVLLIIGIVLNFLSLIVTNRLQKRILSNVTSFICLFPLALLSCLYPFECHIYLLFILIYTLAHFPLILSILISTSLTIIIASLTLKQRIYLILFLITNIIGTYLNRLLNLTICSIYNQLDQSKFISLKTKIYKRVNINALQIDANIRNALLAKYTLNSKMIDSVMPHKFAKALMDDFNVFHERAKSVVLSHQGVHDSKPTVFRPLHIECMQNVSILFADIVSFNDISSNKSSSELVSLLSDLYGRFDHLCVQISCEKIGTLGGCYYCVSGCLEPRVDHARTSILMGLAMLSAIEEFNQDQNQQFDMRVGIHSGSVNCGIIGTRKFQFDIFSYDVRLASKMKSTGKSGKQ